MKHDFSHIRSKDGEPPSEYFTRVVEGWAVAQGKGRVARIQYVLQHLERAARDEGRAEAKHEAEDRHSKETTVLNKRIAELEAMLRASVSKIDAEEARRKAAIGMRTRASDLAEYAIDGGPNYLSVEIDGLPLPKPLWTETTRPQ